MTVPEEELAEVADAAHEVVRRARDAGVWVFGSGVVGQAASVVAPDGTVTAGAYPATKAVVGGLSIVDVSSRDEALRWTAELAVAWRVRAGGAREVMADPDV